jgi:hypothetical protein
MACCRHGPGSPAASARIQPVLRRSAPSRPSTNSPAERAIRSCRNSGRIRALASRSDEAHSSSATSKDAPVIARAPPPGPTEQIIYKIATVMLSGVAAV